MIRPRYWPFWRRRGDRVIGVIALIMAVSITLPIPLGNWLPAFSTFLLGLALSERDGILFAIASIVGIAAIVLVVSRHRGGWDGGKRRLRVAAVGGRGDEAPDRPTTAVPAAIEIANSAG